MLRRPAIALTAAAALGSGALAAAPASAGAETLVSSNWAGYAATGPSFRRVSARWTVTRMRCKAGRASYSAAWVGLGGFAADSPGLEQTGTDSSCAPGGRARYTAWYELVPAPSHAIRMKVRPGHRMSATVTVRGKRVTLVLRNRTTRRRFVKRAKMARPGVESAEWIVETPSGCTADHKCSVLPLGNFGTTRFTRSSATSARGHKGTISDSAWTPSTIVLREGASAGGLGSGAAAVPSPLSPLGASFTVSYRGNGVPGGLAKRAFPVSTLPGHRRPRAFGGP
jgi:hypothetical protein